MSEHKKQNYLNHPKGLMSWILTLDHKRIGLMYLFSGILFFFLGGLLALVMRFELAAPGNDIISNEVYNNAYTLHGAIMIFLFIIPAIPGALGNILLPLMVGAKDVAFLDLIWLVFISIHLGLYLLCILLLMAELIPDGLFILHIQLKVHPMLFQ